MWNTNVCVCVTTVSCIPTWYVNYKKGSKWRVVISALSQLKSNSASSCDTHWLIDWSLGISHRGKEHRMVCYEYWHKRDSEFTVRTIKCLHIRENITIHLYITLVCNITVANHSHMLFVDSITLSSFHASNTYTSESYDFF